MTCEQKVKSDTLRHKVAGWPNICCVLTLSLCAVIVGLPNQPDTAVAQAVRFQEGQAVGPVTGWPIPRFVSIRPNRANVRVGPGGNYAVSWTFVRSGLPVEITAEFGNWRKIRDMDGDEGWIRHDLLAGRRMAVIAPWSDGDPVPARRSANENAGTRYLLEPGVVAQLDGCDGSWCQVSAAEEGQRWRGYIRQNALWGAYPEEAFDAD
ncbi:MAG: SH3 domain-containing protein [Pseudomonadota bacterium]